MEGRKVDLKASIATERRQNVTMHTGNTRELVFSFEELAELQNPDITWAMAESPRADALVEKASTNGDTEIELNGDKFMVKLRPEDTAGLHPRSDYYHEVEVVDGDDVYTVAVGEVKLEFTLVGNGENT